MENMGAAFKKASKNIAKIEKIDRTLLKKLNDSKAERHKLADSVKGEKAENAKLRDQNQNLQANNTKLSQRVQKLQFELSEEKEKEKQNEKENRLEAEHVAAKAEHMDKRKAMED